MPRPNLVLFVPDQLRADAVGCFGNPLARTPHIDALAARGTRFTNAYAQHSVCGPSRASFMTGWYPHVAGHRSLTSLVQPWEPNALKTLREAGYNVAWMGQRGDLFAPGVTEASCDVYGWYRAPTHGFLPFDGVDDRFVRVFYSGRRPAPRGGGPVFDFDEATITSAEQWLAGNPPEPWVLFVALLFPHLPFEAEEPWFSMHERGAMPAPLGIPSGGPRYLSVLRERNGTHRLSPEDWAEVKATYWGMVSRVDDQLGRTLAAVARAGAAERTVTFFFTDHGEYAGDYGVVEKWPSGQHDSLLRNPLVVAGPGVREGAVVDDLVELVDLLPTWCELGEAEVRHTHFGRSLVSLLGGGSGASPHRDAAFSEGGFLLDEEHLTERSGFPYDIKSAIQHDDPATVGRVATIRTPEWTYVHRLGEPAELYDRVDDPGEMTNRADDTSCGEVVRALRDRLLEWWLSTSDVLRWEPDPRFPKVASPPRLT